MARQVNIQRLRSAIGRAVRPAEAPSAEVADLRVRVEALERSLAQHRSEFADAIDHYERLLGGDAGGGDGVAESS